MCAGRAIWWVFTRLSRCGYQSLCAVMWVGDEWEFRRDTWRQKTRVHGLSYDVVFSPKLQTNVTAHVFYLRNFFSILWRTVWLSATELRCLPQHNSSCIILQPPHMSRSGRTTWPVHRESQNNYIIDIPDPKTCFSLYNFYGARPTIVYDDDKSQFSLQHSFSNRFHENFFSPVKKREFRQVKSYSHSESLRLRYVQRYQILYPVI